jgi:hypothetical protein
VLTAGGAPRRAGLAWSAAALPGVAAWVVGGLVLAPFGLCVWLAVLTGDVPVSFVSTTVAALVFAVVGMVVVRRQPHNPIGWLLAGCAALAFLVGVAELYAVPDYRIDHGTLPLGKVAVLAEAAAFVIAVFWIPAE